MNKTVAFRATAYDGRGLRIIRTVLTDGYAAGVVSEIAKGNTSIISFDVNKYDLKDLRHDMEVLNKAGFNVIEVEP